MPDSSVQVYGLFPLPCLPTLGKRGEIIGNCCITVSLFQIQRGPSVTDCCIYSLWRTVTQVLCDEFLIECFVLHMRQSLEELCFFLCLNTVALCNTSSVYILEKRSGLQT